MDAFNGIRRNRSDILDTVEESILADMGLVDRKTLAYNVTGLHTTAQVVAPLESTLGIDLWLRTSTGH